MPLEWEDAAQQGVQLFQLGGSTPIATTFDPLLPLRLRMQTLSASNDEAFNRMAEACQAGTGPELTIGLEWTVEPRFPAPADGDPAKVRMANDLAYVRNNNLSQQCSVMARCSEETLRLKVSFEPSSNLEVNASLAGEIATQLPWGSMPTPAGAGDLMLGGMDEAMEAQQPTDWGAGSADGSNLADILDIFLNAVTTTYTLVVEDNQGGRFGRVMTRTPANWNGPALQVGDSFDILLPQGVSRATLRAERSGRCVQQTFDVTAQDIFIAALGDSYSSGEGAPIDRLDPALRNSSLPAESQQTLLAELLYAGAGASVWARGREPANLPTLSRVATLPGLIGGGAVTLPSVNVERLPGEWKRHHLAHRSPFAPTARAAMDLEASSEHSSVTYVSFAVSGATIKSGIRQPSRYPEEAGTAIDTQIDELGKTAMGRTIDHLVLGFGGNDTGFARVVKALVAREGKIAGAPEILGRRIGGETLRTISRAIYDGKWSEIDSEDDDIAGMNGLMSEYAYLATQLARLQDEYEVTVDRVYLMGYPDLMRFGGRTCEFLRDVADRAQPLANLVEEPQQVFELGAGLEVSSEEAKWARKVWFEPLTDRMKCAAERHGWRFVEMPPDAFALNGICAPEPNYDFRHPGGYDPVLSPSPDPDVRWFRAGAEAFTIQSARTGAFEDGTGLMHPNEHGYRMMSIHLLAAIQRFEDTPECDADQISPVLDVPVRTACLPGENACPELP
jgi:hypothetical protein